MSLLHIEIFGIPIDDSLLFQLIVGGVCALILLIVLGFSDFGSWIQGSFIVWIAATLLIIPLTYVFIDEKFTVKHLFFISIGVVLTIIYVVTAHKSVPEIIINIIQSILWMTVFSIVLDFFKKNVVKRFNP